jgi:hypothetical protein
VFTLKDLCLVALPTSNGRTGGSRERELSSFLMKAGIGNVSAQVLCAIGLPVENLRNDFVPF